MKFLAGIIFLSFVLYSCGTDAEKEEGFAVAGSANDTLPNTQQRKPIDFIGEYLNPASNEVNTIGVRTKLTISKDSLENHYLLSFTSDADKITDSCTLTTKAIKRNDTLFSFVSNGTDSALMYVTQLPNTQRKTLDVFTTKFKDKDVLDKFCTGRATIIGTYEFAPTPASVTDSTQRRLGFIQSFAGKTAGSVQLFSFAQIKDRLLLLLGAKKYEELQQNWLQEQPIAQKQNEIYKASACKTKRCNIYKTNIFFDLPNDNITVIVTVKGETTINTEKPSLSLPPALLAEIERESKE